MDIIYKTFKDIQNRALLHIMCESINFNDAVNSESVSSPDSDSSCMISSKQYKKFKERFDCLLQWRKSNIKIFDVPLQEFCRLNQKIFKLGEWAHLLKTSYLFGRLKGYKLRLVQKACTKKWLTWKVKRKKNPGKTTTTTTTERLGLKNFSDGIFLYENVGDNSATLSGFGNHVDSMNIEKSPEREIFTERFQCILTYGKEHGHFRIPLTFTCVIGDKTIELGKWAHALRIFFLRGRLLPYQQAIIQEACDSQILFWKKENAESVEDITEDLFKTLYKSSPELLIGVKICKYFEAGGPGDGRGSSCSGAWFHGTVHSKVGKYFHVVYSDGDEEDLSLSEVFHWRDKDI